MDILTVVPARGGSKRIPRKNIRAIAGKPMIAWPLEALRHSRYGERLIVSTDDPEIKACSQKYGANVPFMRPAELSDDFTGTTEVVRHALDWYEANVKPVDYVLIVYPTAVFLRIEDINNSFTKLTSDESTEIVLSAAEFPFPIQRAIYLNEDNFVRMFQPEHYYSRSQDLQKAYQDAGQFYCCRSEVIRQNKPLFTDDSKLEILPRSRVVDIDTMEDFELAEKLLKIHTESC